MRQWGGANPQGGVVICERGFRCERERDCSVCRKRGLCENGQEVLRVGKGRW